MTSELERQKRRQMDLLFDDLEKQVAPKEKIVFRDDGKLYDPLDYFCRDGFYPGYFSAGRKVLFVGREPRNISGENGVEVATNINDGWFRAHGIGNNLFWRRIFRMAYGIKAEGGIPFEELPAPDEIKAEMLENETFNFAVINLSKYSNDSEKHWRSDRVLIDRFLHDAELKKRNYLREQIGILEPDVMITGNLWGFGVDSKCLELVFPDGDFSNRRQVGTCSCADFGSEGRSIPLLDVYHFSAIKSADDKVSDRDDFYVPVMKALFSDRFAN